MPGYTASDQGATNVVHATADNIFAIVKGFGGMAPLLWVTGSSLTRIFSNICARGLRWRHHGH